MTFANILADIYRRTGYKSSPPTDVVTRIKAFVNEVQQDLISETGFENLINNNLLLGATASQANYGLFKGTSKIKHIYDYTNRTWLEPLSLADYRHLEPSVASNDTEGVPTHWVDLGIGPLLMDIPTTGSVILYADSSSASDTNTVYVEGFDQSLSAFSYSTAMTGTTGVLISTVYAIHDVTKFYLSAAAVGVVQLQSGAAGGDVYAYIYPGQTYSRHRRVALWPTPSSNLNYRVDFERDITDLVNNNDEPVLPIKFHRLLAIGGRMKEYEKLNLLDRYEVARSEYEQALKKFKFWCYSQSVGKPNLRGPQVAGASRYGAWYPN